MMDNEYKVDACYHSYNSIYSVPVTAILKEEDMIPIHDCILYNKWKWPSFKNWFESKCIVIASRSKINSIIYQSNKYILVTWLAPKPTLLAYPGYEKFVAICGGPAINANKIINQDLKFVFTSDKVWYIDSGETFDIVADADQSIIDKMYSVMRHTKAVRSIDALQTALRDAPRKIKMDKTGTKFYFATTIPSFIWNDYLQNELNRFNVKTTRTRKTWRWKMGYGVADCIAKTSFFTKIFYDSFDGTEIKIFVSNIKTSLNLQSNRLIFKGFILKTTTEGTFGLSCLPKDHQEEFRISLMDISSALRLMILDYLCNKDLSIGKNVCAEIAVGILAKVKCDNLF